VLITFVVDAIEWNHWIKVYVQIVIYHYLTSGYDIILLVVSCERRLYDTSPFMGLVECIVYLATNYGVAGATET
jgi:hypothetical protein